MKTLSEWLETGMMDSFEESDYHDVVCLLNRILLHAGQISNVTNSLLDKRSKIEEFICPLIVRVYNILKRKATENDGVILTDLVKHMDTHQMLMFLYSKVDLFSLMEISFPNIDTEVETLRLIAEDIAEGYYSNYKELKDIHEGIIPNSRHFNPSFRMWDKINKEKTTKNETETTDQGAF